MTMKALKLGNYFKWQQTSTGGWRFVTPEMTMVLAARRECHLARHLDLNGDFWVDPEQKADQWWCYFNEMSKD
jgi:hypothetical protein